MKLFAYRPEMDQQINQIIQRIQLRKNGETVTLHQQRGMTYTTSYGASFHHLKEIADTFTPSFDLADRLWHRQIRETMIIATLLCPPSEICLAACCEWSELISTAELVEQVSMNLFAKTDTITELCTRLSNGGNNMQYATALFSAGWAIRFNNKSFNGIATLKTLEPTLEQLYIPEIRRGFTHYLKQMAKSSNEGSNAAKIWVEKHKTIPGREVQLIVSEVDAEIAWRKENN